MLKRAVGVTYGLYSLWLGQRGPPQAHYEATVMESASTLDALPHFGVRDLHLCTAVSVMDDITFDHMGIQPFHRAWGRTHTQQVAGS